MSRPDQVPVGLPEQLRLGRLVVPLMGLVSSVRSQMAGILFLRQAKEVNTDGWPEICY